MFPEPRHDEYCDCFNCRASDLAEYEHSEILAEYEEDSEDE